MSPRRFQAWFLPAPLTHLGGVEVLDRGNGLEIEVPLSIRLREENVARAF